MCCTYRNELHITLMGKFIVELYGVLASKYQEANKKYNLESDSFCAKRGRGSGVLHIERELGSS